MATGPDVRGQGLGRRVLDQLIDHVADRGRGAPLVQRPDPGAELLRAGRLPAPR